MFVKLLNGEYFNFDYVVLCYSIADINSSHLFILRANLIDGKFKTLAEDLNKVEAENELKRLIKEANHDRLVIRGK